MEINCFFDFGSKLASSTIQAHPIELEIDHLKLMKGDYSGVNFPVVFKQEYGKKFNDILDTGYAGFYIISDRMKSVLEENRLTGWNVFPITLYDKKGKEISGYHGFSVIGHCGPVIYKKSEIIEKRLVPTGPICKYYKGVWIEDWDETDFFTPKGTYQTFITKKAADVLKKNRVTNMYLVNLADIEIDTYDVTDKAK